MDAQERLTLLILASERLPARSQRVIWELAARLPRQRYNLSVWLSADSRLDRLSRALAGCEIPCWRLPLLESRWDLKAMGELWLRFRRTRPSLVHLHEACGGSNRLRTMLASAAGSHTLIVTEHGDVLEPGAAYGPDKNPLLERAALVTVPCNAVAEQLVRRFGVDRVRIRVVPEGTDRPSEEEERHGACLWRRRLGVTPSRPLWLCPSRLEPHKGQSLLLEALVEVKRRGLSFVAVMVGEGPERSRLQRRTAECGLSTDVHFLGDIDDWGALLRAAHAVVLPSLYEAVPHVVYEALARERVVVASAVGGIPEVIVDGLTGLLTQPGDSRALADALEHVGRRPHPASRFGVEGARRIREQHSWEGAVEGYEAVYDETLGYASFVPEGVANGS